MRRITSTDPPSVAMERSGVKAGRGRPARDRRTAPPTREHRTAWQLSGGCGRGEVGAATERDEDKKLRLEVPQRHQAAVEGGRSFQGGGTTLAALARPWRGAAAIFGEELIGALVASALRRSVDADSPRRRRQRRVVAST